MSPDVHRPELWPRLELVLGLGLGLGLGLALELGLGLWLALRWGLALGLGLGSRLRLGLVCKTRPTSSNTFLDDPLLEVKVKGYIPGAFLRNLWPDSPEDEHWDDEVRSGGGHGAGARTEAASGSGVGAWVGARGWDWGWGRGRGWATSDIACLLHGHCFAHFMCIS